MIVVFCVNESAHEDTLIARDRSSVLESMWVFCRRRRLHRGDVFGDVVNSDDIGPTLGRERTRGDSRGESLLGLVFLDQPEHRLPGVANEDRTAE